MIFIHIQHCNIDICQKKPCNKEAVVNPVDSRKVVCCPYIIKRLEQKISLSAFIYLRMQHAHLASANSRTALYRQEWHSYENHTKSQSALIFWCMQYGRALITNSCIQALAWKFCRVACVTHENARGSIIEISCLSTGQGETKVEWSKMVGFINRPFSRVRLGCN